MAEQVDLASLFSLEPPRHRLRGGVFAVDDMDDFVDIEGRERPVDRGARGLQRVTLAAKLPCNTPADLKARPARWEPRPHPPDVFSGLSFLDDEHTDAVQDPMPGQDRGVAPAYPGVGDRFSIRGDEAS